MRWSRKRSRQEVAEVAALRQEAEAREQEDFERVRIPMRKMRERNHVAADIARMIRERGHGEPGTASR